MKIKFDYNGLKIGTAASKKNKYYNPFLIDNNQIFVHFVDTDIETQL